MSVFDPQIILMDIPNKVCDVLQPEIIAVCILLCSKSLKYAMFIHSSADMSQYPGAYPHTSDQYILITYTFFIVEMKFDNR